MADWIFYLDVDGVLGDFQSASIAACGLPIAVDDIWSYGYWEPYMSRKEFDDKITAVKDFWLNIKPYPWAADLIAMLGKHGEVVICTSPGHHPDSLTPKLEWLGKHGFLLSDTDKNYTLTDQKFRLACNERCVLIDDTVTQLCSFMEAGGSAIAFPQQWNTPRALLPDDKIAHVEAAILRLKAAHQPADEVPDLNPKDRVGRTKPGLASLPCGALFEVAAATSFGARKYGRHNWRVGNKLVAGIYYDAIHRHLATWWEGEDCAPDSLIHHLSHVAAGAMILRDAMLLDRMIDDRPPRGVHPVNCVSGVTEKMLMDIPEPRKPFTRLNIESL